MLDFVKLSSLSISELIDYIIKNFHNPLRQDLEQIRKYGLLLMKECSKDEKLNLIMEIFNQFEDEFLHHINREEEEFFKLIIDLENGKLNDKKKLNIFFKLQKNEHFEIGNYLENGEKILDNLCLENNNNYLKLKEILNKIIKDTQDHIFIEDNLLKNKIQKLIK